MMDDIIYAQQNQCSLTLISAKFNVYFQQNWQSKLSQGAALMSSSCDKISFHQQYWWMDSWYHLWFHWSISCYNLQFITHHIRGKNSLTGVALISSSSDKITALINGFNDRANAINDTSLDTTVVETKPSRGSHGAALIKSYFEKYFKETFGNIKLL